MFRVNTSLLKQIARFGIVGVTASGVHFSTVVLLVQMFQFHPLTANIFAFFISFQISYWGQRTWTFKSELLHRDVYPKLILVQIINFALNEFFFSVLLSLQIPYPIALLIVLSILPFFTFLSSKFWVFA